MDKPGPITHWTYRASRFVLRSIIISRCNTKKNPWNTTGILLFCRSLFERMNKKKGRIVKCAPSREITHFLCLLPVIVAKFSSKVCVVGTHIKMAMTA
jgi:hypothetical protein